MGVDAEIQKLVLLLCLQHRLHHIPEVHHVSGAQAQEPGPLPVPEGHTVRLLRLQHRLPGLPGPEQRHRRLQARLGREYQYKGRQVRGLGQVQSAEAPLARQVFLDPRLPFRLGGGPGLGLVVQRQGEPAHVLGGDPLVQPQPAERPLRRLALHRRPGRRPELPGLQRHAVGGVAGFPEFFVVDVQVLDFIRVVPGEDGHAVHHRQPFRIVGVLGPFRLPLAPGQNPPAFLVNLPADGGPVRIVSGRGQHQDRLLPPGGVGAGGQHLPAGPALLALPGVELVAEDGGEGGTVLVLHVPGVDLHHAAEAGADLPHAVPAPRQGLVGGLRQGGVLHHVLGALVDNIRVFLVHGEDAHIGEGLAVRQKMVQAQAGGKFALAVLLRNLVVQEPPVPDPASVIVPDLDAVELPDNLFLPREEFKGAACPLVLAEHQQTEEAEHPVRRFLAVPELRPVVRDGHMDERRQPDGFRHSGPPPGSAGGRGYRPPFSAGRFPAPPTGSGW